MDLLPNILPHVAVEKKRVSLALAKFFKTWKDMPKIQKHETKGSKRTVFPGSLDSDH